MENEVTLIVDEGQGQERRVAVRSSRFTIGRGADSDLALDDQGLSRRHALIERFDGLVRISDCGSRNGTFVNGRQVTGAAALQDGDRISIGNACNLTIKCIHSADQDTGRAEVATGKFSTPVEGPVPSTVKEGVFKTLSGTPAIATAAMTVLVVIVVIAVFFAGESGNRAAHSPGAMPETETQADSNRQGPPAMPDEADSNTNTAGVEPVSIEQIEKAASQVMRRISSDSNPYVFPPNAVDALGDIKRKVEQYRESPALEAALQTLNRRGPEIATLARREGVEPYLVIYVALAVTDGGRTGQDTLETGRRILPELLSLRATFGTEMADKSLILVAAYKMGGGTKKSHPLLVSMRRIVKNPHTERNVWHLYERGGLDAEVYDFVVSFLALGIISQNPSQFGIRAAPLAL